MKRRKAEEKRSSSDLEIPSGIVRIGWEEQSQRQGGQVLEVWLTAAKPSMKCQYRGGPTMQPNKHRPNRLNPTFNAAAWFTVISFFFRESLFWLPENEMKKDLVNFYRFRNKFDIVVGKCQILALLLHARQSTLICLIYLWFLINTTVFDSRNFAGGLSIIYRSCNEESVNGNRVTV